MQHHQICFRFSRFSRAKGNNKCNEIWKIFTRYIPAQSFKEPVFQILDCEATQWIFTHSSQEVLHGIINITTMFKCFKIQCLMNPFKKNYLHIKSHSFQNRFCIVPVYPSNLSTLKKMAINQPPESWLYSVVFHLLKSH